MFAMQMLQRLQELHEMTFLHRNLDTENILIGQGKKAGTIYLINYGNAKRYINPCSGEHIQFKEKVKQNGKDQLF